MNFTRSAMLLALGVPLLLGGCATRESVERAQASADAADAHAGTADEHAADAAQRAIDARGRADHALAVGTSAGSTAAEANARAAAAEDGLKRANARITYLEHRLHISPRHHRVVHHRKPKTDTSTTPPAPDKPASNS